MEFYKRILKNREIRLRILSLFDFIPDKLMIKLQYRIKTGKKLNLTNPERYTEKLQWYKLNYHNKLMTKCVDKYEVREFVKEKGYENILNNIYGVWQRAEEIEFDKLPEKFVLKTTNGSHTNIFCYDKNRINKKEIIKTFNNWLKPYRRKIGREWAYYNVSPRIICEELLPKDKNNDLPDYKFFCFKGKIEYLYVIKNRKNDSADLGIFDVNFNQLPFYRMDENKLLENVEKPTNFEKMIEIAKRLSEDFPHVRVDLYNIDGKIFFGELTFYDGSGYQTYNPDEFDYILGEKFDLDIRKGE